VTTSTSAIYRFAVDRGRLGDPDRDHRGHRRCRRDDPASDDAPEVSTAASPLLRLEIEELFQQFGVLVAVDHLSATVNGGEIVGLVGRNGAGKTTTMRSVMGILNPMGGSIRWSGHDVTLEDRLRFGYMPEERGLYPQMRVLNQLVYIGRLHGLSTEAATKSAGEWIRRLGLEGREQDRVVALSHGNQQRVQLGVALVYEPDLLILDEPFAGLDPSAVDTLSDVLREVAALGRAILFSSHQLDLVERLCDRIVIVEKGGVLASGTLAELRARVPQRLRVQVGSPSEWWANLDGARILSTDGDGVVFDLRPGDDTQDVLRAATAAGPLQHFSFESGGLTELYRELVAQ
jgi:ABC-2 type transport system ATP-binding protein